MTFRKRLAFWLTAALALFGMLVWTKGVTNPAVASTQTVPNALPPECATGLTSDVATDTTWSGAVYIADDITVDSAATLTITPGTDVYFCGEYRLKVGTLFDPGRLVARGTPDDPIMFQAADATVTWTELFFEDHEDAGPSVLQFAAFSGGGGSDPATGQTLLISDRATIADYHTPLIDHVTIHDSSGYGINLGADATGDPTPPLLTNVTVENSALAPIITDPAAITGLGSGLSMSNNNPDRILVRGGQLGFDQRWRDYGVPYELTDDVYARSAYTDTDTRPAVWTLDPGVVLLAHPDINLTIGSLYGTGSLQALGTAADPITVTRLNDVSAPWSSLRFNGFNNFDSELRHVALLHGGGLAGIGNEAVITHGSDAVLRLDNVTIQQSLNGAIYGGEGRLWIRESAFNFNRFGISFYGSDAQVRDSDLSSNVEFAFVNGSPTNKCFDAVGNYWGPNGPLDTSATLDACGSTKTNGGTGEVSDGVRYTPWLAGGDGYTNFGSILPDQHWVIADGLASTKLKITLWDALGVPVAGKQVVLESNLGTITQPAAPTNINGETTAVISSTEPGFTTISAYNITDDEPVAGLSGVNFWQGSGDFGGLLTPSGAPYASPALVLQGQPFQQGFPVDMRVPMRNSLSSPIDVEVIYGVSRLAVGVRFLPVYTTTKTLQPGEIWDANGVWLPTVTGHHCVQATVNTDAARSFAVNENTDETQENTNQNPCTDLPSNTSDFAPSAPSFNGGKDTRKVAKHYQKQGSNLMNANNCIADQVSFKQLNFTSDVRDYEIIVTPPAYTPPPILPDADVTQAQTDALNALSQTSADILGLNLAMGVTRQRMNWAAQADALDDLDRQYAAFLDFVDQYVQKHRTYADQIDTLLTVTEGAGMEDGFYYPEDFEQTYDALAQQGFDAETHTYLEQSGLDPALIEEIRQDILAARAGRIFETISFFDMLREARDTARTIADDFEAQYGGIEVQQALAGATTPLLLKAEPQAYEFQVGHGSDVTETVDLIVRPVGLPIDWSYSLAEESVSLGPDEIITTTVTLIPGELVPEKSVVQLAVEGYVNDELVGGVLFTYNAPVINGQRLSYRIYLPTVLK